VGQLARTPPRPRVVGSSRELTHYRAVVLVTVAPRRYLGPMNATYLVTGASRGLGAEFVRQLREQGHSVVAAVRDPDSARDATRAGATVTRLDVDRPDTFDAFAGGLDAPVDVLVHNAGIAAGGASLGSLTADAMERVFRTNVFGPALLTKALLPRLRQGTRKLVVHVSSGLGSLASTPGGFSYAYCASKSALNMLTVLLHQELSGSGFTVVSLDPGWNRTDMGGAAAPLDPAVTVRSMVAMLERLGPGDSGKFLGWDGLGRQW
jgi:NAD(P)-dependent dehydrogenase (short-subunit alcohol dehydrogenase family)